MTTTVTDDTGAEIGMIRQVRAAVDRNPTTGATTHEDCYSAAVLTRDGVGYLPTTPERHPTEQAARQAVVDARAAQRPPEIPKGLRLGVAQKHAMWLATTAPQGLIEDDDIGEKLAAKGLAKPHPVGYALTNLGYQVAAKLFDPEGSLR